MTRAETRNWEHLLARDATACPRPDKRAFPTKREAKKTLNRMQGAERKGIQPYRCACGSFHLGHRA